MDNLLKNIAAKNEKRRLLAVQHELDKPKESPMRNFLLYVAIWVVIAVLLVFSFRYKNDVGWFFTGFVMGLVVVLVYKDYQSRIWSTAARYLDRGRIEARLRALDAGEV